MRNWYVLWVQGGKEEAIADKAQKLSDVDILLPLARFKGSSKNAKEVVKPIFPNYIFINCEMKADKYYELKGLDGVRGWLGFDEMWPTAVPPQEIQRVQQLVELNADGNADEIKCLLDSAKVDKHKKLVYGSMKLLGKNHKITLPTE